jgi:branched-chain amino acid transport system ATP-binding protein
MIILEINQINTYYGLSHILFDVSLYVGRGEIIYYLGRNGAGKTTTIRSIMGLTPPRQGSIKFKGAEIVNKAPFEICRLGIGWIPSGRKIFPDLTVVQNLEVVQRPCPGRAYPWTVKRVFDLFPPLKELANHKWNQLSGGEKQMLAIGRTLMTNPELLVMDEPSEGLSPLVLKWLNRQILEINRQEITIILTEQNVKFALGVAHRGYVIDNGKICYEGTIEELRSNPEMMHRYLAL